MTHSNNSRRAEQAFRTAFRVAPKVAREVVAGARLGIYGWQTPDFEGFELPESDELVLALHLGGSRKVRAVTDHGLSRAQSTPGMVTILPPGRPVAFRTEGSVRVATLHLSRGGDDNGPLERLARCTAPRFAFRDPYVSASMEAMLQAARSDRPLHPEYLTKLADALLCHLAQLADLGPVERAVEDARLHELVQYVDGHLGERLTLDDLAARAGMSRAQFTRSFRDATGESAHRYITRRRVEAAQRLLSQTSRDLAWIANETGFSSQSHFTRQFHALTGNTPGRFREGH